MAQCQGSSPYCIRTDLVQNQKETGFRKWSASFCEVPLPQGIPAIWAVGTVKIPSEIKRKRTNVPRGELRLSELTMIDKEILDMARKIENMGIYLSLVSQLDKLARHNRQGSFRTKERYYEAMKRFCAYLADEFRLQKLENISGKHLTSYVLWMQENGKSPITIKGKGGKVRTVPINEQIAIAMRKQLERTPRGHKLLVPDDLLRASPYTRGGEVSGADQQRQEPSGCPC